MFNWLAGIVSFIPFAILAVALALLGAIANGLASLGGVILDWTINGFTNIPYTIPGNPPGGNPIIATGLSITQSLANMILVLILVWIGIAVMIRRPSYEIKKILPKFLLIALIVNFAPVICGLIVDAANIIMNYFLSRLGGYSILIGKFGALWTIIKGSISVDTFKATEQIPIVIKLLLLAVSSLALFFILLAFAFMLLARRIIIWILVILAPLAFVLSILPSGNRFRKYWDQWWNAFLDWSLMGIFLAFFLYLGDVLSTLMTNGTINLSKAEGIGSDIIPYFVPIGFYAIGLMFGLSFMGMGSKMLGFAKGKFLSKGKALGATALAGASARGRELLQKTGVQSAANRMATMSGKANWGQGQTGIWARTKQTAAAAQCFAS